MKPRRLRSGLITAIIILLAAAAWLFLAPTRIGGSTTYVVTSGVSMQPRFHTGDLALVRPAGGYHVGMIVAYHSSLLRVVVLHRIVAIHNGRYTFKGDNNNFLDPVRPTRGQLIGALWLRVPHGGRVLKALHAKVTVILLCVFVGLLLVGGTEKRRRGRRGGNRSAGAPRPDPMRRLRDNASAAPAARSLLIGTGVAAIACLVLGGFALHHRATKTTTHTLAYTQQASFGYHADAPHGAVYPDGQVNTGDPIFLALVHRIGVTAVDTFTGPAATQIRGSEQLVLTVTGSTGWSRSIPLTPVRHFRSARGRIAATLDLDAVQALLVQVGRQTGLGASGYSLAVALNAHVNARIMGQPVHQDYNSALNFTLSPLQLQAAPGTASAAKKGSLASTSVEPNPLHVLGRNVSSSALAWLAFIGLIICGSAAIPLVILLKRNWAFDEAARIRSRYGHLLVPILIGEDLGWPPVDVGNFRALVRLAEASGQVILHHQADAVDTYLVNDNGTVYRYQISLPSVTWGEWSETNVAVDPAALAETANALAKAAAPPVNGAAPTPAAEFTA